MSESGIGSVHDLKRLEEAGFDAALIGERLITQPEPGRALAELLAPHGSKAGIEELEVRN